MSGAVNSILEVKSGRTEYILSPVFEPVWNQTGKIFAFEMLSDIRSAKDGRKICASVFSEVYLRIFSTKYSSVS